MEVHHHPNVEMLMISKPPGELYNYINMEKGQLEQCMSVQENYKIKAERLIAFINKEYHFKNGQ